MRIEPSNLQRNRSDIATDFSKLLISCKKLESSQTQTGRFKYWAENETKSRKKATRFQNTLKDNCQLCVSDLLNSLASRTNRKEAYENTLPIIQVLDIIVRKVILRNSDAEMWQMFPPGTNKPQQIPATESQGYPELSARRPRLLRQCSSYHGPHIGQL